MTFSVTPRSRRARRRTACLAAALLAAGTLAGASHALVGRQHDARSATTRTPARVLTIAARPATRTVTRGATARYPIRIGGYGRYVRPGGRDPSRLAVRIWMSVSKPWPRGVSARFTTHATRSSTTALKVTTTARTRPGRYRLRLRARGHLGRPGHRRMRLAWTTVTLVVSAPRAAAFTIGGTLTTVLVPGRVVPLDLRLTNPRGFALGFTRLAVAIDGIRAPRASASRPCSARDFAVVQRAGSDRLRVPAGRTRTLSALGVAPARLPRVAMLNRAVNQDGCKQASLRLRFTGTAIRG
jgi:hypothetical protein